MNKVFNINLGGYPFTIDQDAYESLSHYLDTIHHHFRGSEGYEEITGDIEGRMAELFQEKLSGRSIVTIKEVNEAISIMGTPEEFGAEPLDEMDGKSATKRGRTFKTGKRLFRNPDDKVVGGVCSGIAAYLGVEDPIWVRLAFILIIISGGIGIPAYLILWAIVPEAESASDRLAMRGEPINASNIGRIIEEEFQNFSETVSGLGSELRSKKSFGENENNARGTLKKGISILGSIIVGIVNLLLTIWKPIVFIVGFALIIAFTVMLIVSIISFVFASPLVAGYLLPESPGLSSLAIANAFFIIGIPILSLILVCGRLLFRRRVSNPVKIGLTVFWFVNLFSFASIGGRIVEQFNHASSLSENIDLTQVNSDTLILEFKEDQHRDIVINMGPLKVGHDYLVNGAVQLYIEKGESDQFELEQINYSRGLDRQESQKIASNIDYTFRNQGNVIAFEPNFLIPKGEKYRGQSVRLVLKVPQGKALNIKKSASHFLHNIDLSDRHVTPWRHPDETWRMDETGLTCLNCGGHAQQLDESYSYQDFNQLIIDGRMKVMVEKGDRFQVRVTGKEVYTKKVEINLLGNILNITSPLEHPESPIRLYVTMPHLQSIDVKDTDDVKISGFEERSLSIKNRGRYDIKAYVNVDTLTVRQEGQNELDIHGSGKYLSADLESRAKLDAERFTVNSAKVKVNGNSYARIAVADTLSRQLIQGRIKIDGDPVVIDY